MECGCCFSLVDGLYCPVFYFPPFLSCYQCPGQISLVSHTCWVNYSCRLVWDVGTQILQPQEFCWSWRSVYSAVVAMSPSGSNLVSEKALFPPRTRNTDPQAVHFGLWRRFNAADDSNWDRFYNMWIYSLGSTRPDPLPKAVWPINDLCEVAEYQIRIWQAGGAQQLCHGSSATPGQLMPCPCQLWHRAQSHQWTRAWTQSCALSVLQFIVFYGKRDHILIFKSCPKPNRALMEPDALPSRFLQALRKAAVREQC